MKLAILSDTHGNYPLAVKALESLDSPDYIIHLGDTSDDAEMIELALGREIIKLSGNCDMAKKYPELIITMIDGNKCLLSHGDQFMVKNGLNLIQRRAKREEADLVLYGHTHRPVVQNLNGVLYINPGEMGKNSRLQSFALLSIENGAVTAETVDIRTILPTQSHFSSVYP
ncbi:MAG: metallophosphoesterase [Deltaproteobacteria bacterium]